MRGWLSPTGNYYPVPAGSHHTKEALKIVYEQYLSAVQRGNVTVGWKASTFLLKLGWVRVDRSNTGKSILFEVWNWTSPAKDSVIEQISMLPRDKPIIVEQIFPGIKVLYQGPAGSFTDVTFSSQKGWRVVLGESKATSRPRLRPLPN